MARVAVSARRISSMLANRHQTAVDAASTLSPTIDLARLATEDCDIAFEDLVALANHFKRPWSYLLVDEAEVFKTAGQDNRSLGNQRQPPSPELLDEIEAVIDMLDAAAELFPETRYEIPPARITTDTSPENAGAAIRAFLGISTDEQMAAKDPYGALRLWGDGLQSRGVYFAQRALHDDTIRAFSRISGEQAVIVVDTADPPYARIFSLLHEYCHVILRSTGLCDLSEHSAVERHCNAVAAAALMPLALVRSTLAGGRFGRSAEADDDLLRSLSGAMHVSQAALLIRLRDAGVVDQAAYDEMEARRSGRRPQKEKHGGKYYPVKINRVGRRYAFNVFGALDDGLIDRQDAAALLEVGQHLIPTYRNKLRGPTQETA